MANTSSITQVHHGLLQGLTEHPVILELSERGLFNMDDVRNLILIGGTVMNVGRDAINDEKLGLVYAARVRLDARVMHLPSGDVPLSPGMVVQAEIRTGERRIIQYLLSPLAKATDEAGRER